MTKKKKENEEEILKNEHIERVLSPHPLSFMKLQSLCLFLIIWGVVVYWLVNFSDWKGLFSGNDWFPVLAWGLVMLLFGVVASLIAIRWSVFFMYLAVFVCAVGLMLWQNWLKDSALFIPVFSVAASIVGFLIVELYRRSHKYIISNLRIAFKGGIFTKQERTVRYDKITDINAKQGILGQIFGFGTIIPITQAGFGLGSDKTFAAGGVEIGGKKAKLFGLAGGGKEVQTPRARSYYELHGVYPYKEIKKLIENLVQESVITPYQQEQTEFQRQQVDIQKQMRDLLKMQMKTKKEKTAVDLAKMREEDEEEEEPEEEEPYEPEQVDIQEQMKTLLKKQLEVKGESTEEQDEEEEPKEEK
ncbi:MAG: PH domain-containing protein [Candidatus Thermoplasmatota archaeon]|jgi:membrane protein YdbS with pleckstrin-like domain|nr:PH domain-containing protein [Candidatus Thermoplasmatota archaeon]